MCHFLKFHSFSNSIEMNNLEIISWKKKEGGLFLFSLSQLGLVSILGQG